VVVFDIRLLDDPLGLSAVAPRSPPAPLGLPTFRPTLPSPSSALLPAGPAVGLLVSKSEIVRS
jgi:hypothetical protein